MSNLTKPDIEWSVAEEDGSVPTWERVAVAVLMDVRRELKRLNAAIYCPNFQDIPSKLEHIKRNTRKKRRRAKK